MRVFRRHSAGATDETAQDSPGAQSPGDPDRSQPATSPAEAAKGRPTPKRSVAERNRRQPITGARAPAGPRTPEEKSQARTERARKVEAMQRGESWALNPKDRGPARALARDYIDSKRRVSEYYMYVLVLLLIGVFRREGRAELHLAADPGARRDPADRDLAHPPRLSAAQRAAAGRAHEGPDAVRHHARPADPQAPGPGPAGQGRERDLADAQVRDHGIPTPW